MTQWHLKSKRKITGGRRTSVRRSDKKLAWKGGNPAETKVGESNKAVRIGGRGRTSKNKLKSARYADVADKASKKIIRAEIVSVFENRANRAFVREKVITKGAKIRVKIGGSEREAVVTSRPGQEGVISAKLISSK